MFFLIRFEIHLLIDDGSLNLSSHKQHWLRVRANNRHGCFPLFDWRGKNGRKEGSQVSIWIHENTCFSSPSVIHRGLTPHLVSISIALVALPHVKAQMHSCTKDRDLWLCCCHPLGSKPELTWKTGLTLWGFQGEEVFSLDYSFPLYKVQCKSD